MVVQENVQIVVSIKEELTGIEYHKELFFILFLILYSEHAYWNGRS